jgi:hypothetical protein
MRQMIFVSKCRAVYIQLSLSVILIGYCESIQEIRLIDATPGELLIGFGIHFLLDRMAPAKFLRYFKPDLNG